MSRYCEIKTQFKDQESLILALMESGGWTRDQIEVHEIPQNLFGYQNDERDDVANIIIRRNNVSHASNDLGFIKNEDGQFQAIISNYDRNRYNDKWLGNLTGNYAFRTLEKDQRSRGRSVSRTRSDNGHQRIEISGYR